MTADTTVDSPRGRRRLPRRVAIVMLVIMLPLAGHALWDYVELRRLIREIEAIRSKGEPVTAQEAGRGYQKLTGEQERSSRYYAAAAALAAETFPGYHTLNIDLHASLEGIPAGQPSRDETTRQLRAVVEGARDALALLDIATPLDFKVFPPGTSYSYRMSGVANLSRLNWARTAYLSLSGDCDGAADSVIAAAKLRRVLKESGYLLGSGSLDVPVVLGLCPPSVPALERLGATLQSYENADLALQEALVRRAEFLEDVWHQYYGTDPAAPRHYLLPMRSLTESLVRPWFSHELVGLLRRWSALVGAARKPWPEKGRATAIVLRNQPRSTLRQPLPAFLPFTSLRSLWFALPLSMRAGDPLAEDRASRAAIAVERFRRDHAMALPATLEALVPTYLTAIPLDPFTGEPLRYKRDEDGYTIYSVGADEKDDGGDLTSGLREALEKGFGRKELRGRDEGVRVLTRTGSSVPSITSPSGGSAR